MALTVKHAQPRSFWLGGTRSVCNSQELACFLIIARVIGFCCPTAWVYHGHSNAELSRFPEDFYDSLVAQSFVFPVENEI